MLISWTVLYFVFYIKLIRMKNIWFYYLLIVVPMITLHLLGKYQLISPAFFAIFLLTYALIYHPLLSGYRLIAMGVIRKEQIWKCFIPLWINQYSKELFTKFH
jgi:hypothetical protein